MKLRTSHYVILTFLVAFTYFYSRDGLVATSVLYTAIQFSIPLALAAMVGVMCERTGVVNIGIEGTMLISAFTAFLRVLFCKIPFGECLLEFSLEQ